MATVLFVTTRIPYPPQEGHQIRSYNLLKRICDIHDVHLLTFARREESTAGLRHLRVICKSVRSVPIPVEYNRFQLFRELASSLLTDRPFVVRKYFSPVMAEYIKESIENEAPDLVHLDMLPLAQYRRYCDNLPIVLDEHNVESLLLERRAKDGCHDVICSLFFKDQARKLRRFEMNACNAVNQVLACSFDDARTLESLARKSIVEVIPNGVAVDYFTPRKMPDRDPFNMVFVGGMGWFPNRDGMEYFLEEVMPLVCRRMPEANCTIVGKADGLRIPRELEPRVRLTGFVDDFRPYVWRAGLYVLPLRIGSGTRLKLLEAMAMGKAIVSTPVGCEGIDVSHGEELLVAESPKEMADAIVRLMGDPEYAHRLGERAHHKATKMYDWKSIGDRLLVIYRALLEQKG